jgi:peptidoglycan hydrolase CwlO-like protein
VNTLEEILKQILNELKAVNLRLDTLETDVKDLKRGQQELITDMKQVKVAVLETHSTVKEINSKQNEQQIIIQELTYKTTLHDNVLKHLK